MARTTTAALAVLASAAPGCFLFHGLDEEDPPPRIPGPGPIPDPVPVDAGAPDSGPPPFDAGGPRGGDYWTLDPVDAYLVFLNEIGCTTHAGGTAILTVHSYPETECMHAGPVQVARDTDGTYVVSAYAWVRHPGADGEPCRGITAQHTRSVPIETTAEGTVRAVDARTGAAVELGIAAAPSIACTGATPRVGSCLLDCECEVGLVCVPTLGDAEECHGGRCGAPCDLQGGTFPAIYDADLDCAADEVCRDAGGAAAPTCRRREMPSCDVDEDCTPGMACPVSSSPMECNWSARLDASVRHACWGDADCDPGLHCVERDDGRRTCEVPCFTNDMRCPGMHACGLPGAPAPWVCEWIGE
jgi:hypothetical protein